MKVCLLTAAALVALLPLTFAVAKEPPRDVAAPEYSRLVYSHLQLFKGRSTSTYGVSGRVIVRFVLERGGNVVSSAVLKSSGNAALDQEALAIVRRASPFPPFPASSKPDSSTSFAAPFNFLLAGLCEPGTMVPMADGKMHVCQ